MSVFIEGHMIAEDNGPEDRIRRFLLLPYGQEGRTSAGRMTASAGSLRVPEDVSTLVVNVQHDRKRPAAKFVDVQDTQSGMIASVRYLNTSTGNDMLTEADEGVRPGISVEVDGLVVRNGRMLDGYLTAAGFVTEPAFPSALMVAADAGDLPANVIACPDCSSTLAVPEGTTPTLTHNADGSHTFTPQEPDQDDPAPAEADDKENDVTVTTTDGAAGGTVTAAAAPAGIGTMTAARPIAERPLNEVMRFLATKFRDGGEQAMTAALSDIKANTGVGANLIPPAWIGELWNGRTYKRRYVPLVTNQNLTGMTLKGWKWGTKPAVATYAGDKAAVTSNTPTTSAVSVSVQRLAGAHDVDRAYRDFDVTEFWESYYRAMTDSYAMLSDLACLADLITGATAPAAPGSGLSTWTPAASIIDGAMAIIAAGGTPTGAIVGADLYKTLLLTPQQNMIELLSGGLGLDSSQMEGFTIVPSASASLTGKALTLDKGGFVFAELPGSPIRVEAINQANAGIDPGVFGYYADYTVDPLLVQLISKPTA